MLRMLQKKTERIIKKSHYLAHTDPMFSKLKLLKLDDLYKHQLCISTNRLLPDSMSSMVINNVHVTIISEIELDNTSSKLELTAGN